MNILVAYYSKYGNTKRIAASVSEVLKQAGPTQLMRMEQLSDDDLTNVDLLVIGSPTYYQRVPKDVHAVLKTLSKRSLEGKLVTAFDTSLKMWGPIMLMTAAHGIMSRLRKLGGKKIISRRTDTVVLHEGAQVGRRGAEQGGTHRHGGDGFHPGETALPTSIAKFCQSTHRGAVRTVAGGAPVGSIRAFVERVHPPLIPR